MTEGTKMLMAALVGISSYLGGGYLAMYADRKWESFGPIESMVFGWSVAIIVGCLILLIIFR